MLPLKKKKNSPKGLLKTKKNKYKIREKSGKIKNQNQNGKPNDNLLKFINKFR